MYIVHSFYSLCVVFDVREFVIIRNHAFKIASISSMTADRDWSYLSDAVPRLYSLHLRVAIGQRHGLPPHRLSLLEANDGTSTR